MKIKLLSAIVSFLFITVAISSCLDSDDDNVEYSSDDTIRAFELDTIYGVNHKFTIDQVNRKIYNVDSLPVSSDTIINKILIKTITTSAYYITTGDTLFNTTDSVDLSKTMTDPFRIKLHAADGLHTREYAIEVRRHLQEPDSLTWSKLSDSFSNGEADGIQKTVILNGDLLTLISNTTLFSSSPSDGKSWEKAAISGLPTNIKLTSIINFKNTLYIVAEDGKVFSSINGTNWVEAPISGNVIALLATFPDYIGGIITVDGVNKFAITDSDISQWETGEIVPGGFPLENISSTSFKTNTGLQKYMVAGKSTKVTVPWFTFDGKGWADLATSSDYYLPEMAYPTILHYNDSLYAFGENLDSFYTSTEGIVWKPKTRMVFFPEEFQNGEYYSTVTDDNNYIWIIRSKDDTYNDEVWRGRINRLGFLIK